MTRYRNEAVVCTWIDRNRTSAELRDESVHGAVALGLGRRERREEPRRAFEEIRARAPRTANLGAADRMPTHEPWVVSSSRADRRLRRANVGDRARGRSRLEDVLDDGRQPRVVALSRGAAAWAALMARRAVRAREALYASYEASKRRAP